MPKYKAEAEQPAEGQEGGAPEGGDNPLAAMMGGGAPVEPKAEPSAEPKPDAGNAMPDAPNATRLSEDKTPKPMKPKRQKKVKAVKAEEKPVPDTQEVLSTQSPDAERLFAKDGVQNGCGVIVVKDGKILTGIRRTDKGYGQLCGAGGTIEDGETALEGAVRETREEFGIIPKDLIFIGRGEASDGHNNSYLFLCTDFYGEPKTDDMEMDRPVWRTLKEIQAIPCYPAFKNGVDKLIEVLGKKELTPEKVRERIYHFDFNGKVLTPKA